MANISLYILTVVIWGTTWIAMKLQVGDVPPEVSILYRTALTSCLLAFWCHIKGASLKFRLLDHFYIFLLALSMLSIHLIFVFDALQYLPSGVVSVVFAGVSFLSIVNNFIFFRVKPNLNILAGTIVGLMGLAIFFWKEVEQLSFQSDSIQGLLYASIGVLIFSLGGSISKRNNSRGIEIVPAVTIGTFYATVIMASYALYQGNMFTFPVSSLYWGALLYTVIFSSIIAFLGYLYLIKQLGPERAGYMTVLFPAIALVISSVFEGYVWTLSDLVGMVCIIIGNILLLRKTLPRKEKVVTGLLKQNTVRPKQAA